MAWARPEADSFWDNVRILLVLGHRPAHIAAIYDHKGDIVQKIRWRSHEYWKDVNVKRSSHRGPRCPRCRNRRPTFKRDLCKECYYAVLRKGRPTGADHHAWKGGKSFDPSKIRLSAEYRQFRKQVMEYGDYQCSVCGVIEDSMELDHIIPQVARPDLIFVHRNVRILCGRCHKRTATYSTSAKYFQWLFVTSRITPEEKLEKFEQLHTEGNLSLVEIETIRYFLVGDGRQPQEPAIVLP